jgi:hypothetical protein
MTIMLEKWVSQNAKTLATTLVMETIDNSCLKAWAITLKETPSKGLSNVKRKW